MRTEDQLADIENRATCGYARTMQGLTEDLSHQSLTDPSTTFFKLLRGKQLLDIIERGYMSRFDRNLAADQLTRLGFVVKQEADELYHQEGCLDNVVDFSE